MEQYEKLYLYKRIVQAKLFIDANFAEDIDLDNIADQASFSKFHFIRLFKSIYGKSPHNYLVKVRIDNARKFLADGDSVFDACIRVGFESPTAFAAAFKKVTGKTPSGYRDQSIIKRNASQLRPLAFVPNCFAETHGWK